MSKSSAMHLRSAATANARRHSGATSGWKWTLAAAAVVVLVGGMVVFARPDGTPQRGSAVAAAVPAAPGQLSALGSRYSFGTISMAGGKVTHRYRIANSGGEPVLVRKIYTSCMCTTAALVRNGKSSDAFGMPGHTPIPVIDVPLTPTDAAYIEVVFDPAAHGPAGIGLIERVVTVENTAGRPLELQFTAMVTP